MVDLSTEYMGLRLRNPVIVSSSSLTATVQKVAACEQAGAGGVVLKSLFEEQILADTNQLLEGMDDSVHPEARALFTGSGTSHYMNDYLKLLRQAKEQVSIPVIASINCVTSGAWIEYAESFEKVGADGLELNVFIIPANVNKAAGEIEETYFDICRKIKKRLNIPVAMKIGPHFSSMARMIRQLSEERIDALVLFNRFYRPDVDVDGMRIVPAPILSTPQEMSLPLQWIALLSGEIPCDFSATTGVHDGKAVVKQLLVGAKTVQMCSALLKNGIEYLGTVLTEVTEWMEEHHYRRIEDFRGDLCQERSEHPEIYERSQYIKALVGIS